MRDESFSASVLTPHLCSSLGAIVGADFKLEADQMNLDLSSSGWRSAPSLQAAQLSSYFEAFSAPAGAKSLVVMDFFLQSI